MSQNLSLSKTKKFSLPTIRNAYSEKPRVIADMSGPSRTKQSFKEECDVNNIMRKFARTGVIDFTNRNEPRYGDCTGYEFQQAMDTVASAKSMFEELPAKLRARFDNDPAAFLEFVADTRNREEARELGLLRPEAAAAIPPKAEGAKASSADPDAPKGEPKGKAQSST